MEQAMGTMSMGMRWASYLEGWGKLYLFLNVMAS